MYGSTRLLFVLFLAGILVLACKGHRPEPYSSQEKQSKTVAKPAVSTLGRFEENAPTLLKVFRVLSEVVLVLVWVVDSGLSIILSVINEAAISCSGLALAIFGALFNIVKLLEAFGFGVKFILELNYTMVSRLLDLVNFLQENVHHAVVLVKITLANETDYVYESSSLAMEGVHSLFLTTCHQTWDTLWLAWEKLKLFTLWFIDNITWCFGLPVPNVSLIASTSAAAVKFFLESFFVTTGVVYDGVVFLSRYLADVCFGLGSRLLVNILVVFNTVLNTITMVTQCVIVIVTWPLYLFTSLVSRSVNLICSLWDVLVKQASVLDQSARWFIRYVFDLVKWFTLTFSSRTSMFVNTYIPGGVTGFCVIVITMSGVVVCRETIISHIRLAWFHWRTENAVVHDEQDLHVGNEVPMVVGEVNENREQPEMPLESERPLTRQKKWRYELEKEKDKRLCVICQDKVKNILLLPCRHVCLCQRCLEEIRHNRVQLIKCPLCRHYIQSTMEVFV